MFSLTPPVELDHAKSYGDIFTLVKKAVKRSLELHRVGLMLYLGNLPIRVGAFHPMGTNEIVLNRRLLGSTKSLKEKSQVFAILVHEYLHTLGFSDERQVRRLTYKVCSENFGKSHPAVEAALTGPWTDLTEEDFESIEPELNLELVRDFERIDSGYII
ncbi:hypothetical protein A3K69_06650 [Candidatus Bathyarchaeota archaeon RBG_16_57_9]|nr:MAG: hypothetical protein A3K69_06650 [Candidatus Bathyarchaeota archaeon RBG_16_57_9]OGD55698.1 MAG: hypothetical protein A3K81_01695 [Candidatus Bathyarchaeota archaeon RBG_13_60_20]